MSKLKKAPPDNTADPDPAQPSEPPKEDDPAKEERLKEFDANITSLNYMQEHLYTLAAGSLDRRKFAAEIVLKASAAIATLYSGVLALIFSVSGTQLPLRGILAPVFLGLAVVLSAASQAYTTPRVKENTEGDTADTKPDEDWVIARGGGAFEPRAIARVNIFIQIAAKMAQRNSWMLRASVIALGVGLAGIALPFISSGSPPSNADREASISSSYPWPTASPTATSANDVALYQAQVDEVAAARANARAKPLAPQSFLNSTGFFAGSLVVGLLIVVIGATAPNRSKTHR
ncbi:hypothetical protein [Arthrobacter mobilis]|uniref:Uncharacterized protein n=1 Tax=Arthrobacter mobilis TaxID=2724944 RepID=A0A7X6K6R6_9MICC|nr:hypothetical protein [Arthrobacter mobilis]NKX56289.1 hypothetical protein [Arthrobacter mobilis]